MNDTNDQGLFREIEEDMARKRLEAMWKKYAPYVFTGALLIVGATAATTGWKSYKQEKEQRITSAYLEILDKKLSDTDGAEAEHIMGAFESFAKENKGESTATFARLEEASVALAQKNKEKALALYSELAADTSVDPIYRQMADLLYVKNEMDTADPKMLMAKLEALMKEGVVWRPSATEFAGHLAVRQGDMEKAKEYFSTLKLMPDVSVDIAQRAESMLKWLNKGA